MATLQVLVSAEPDDEVGIAILSQINGINVVTYDPDMELPPSARNAQVLIPPYRSSHRPLPLLRQLKSLQLVQLLSAGADEWSADVPLDVVLSTARGAHAAPVSEWVLSAILCLYRQWPALVRHQDARTWAHRRVHADTLKGKKVLVVGAGAIGSAVAERVTALGAHPTLVARSARPGVHAVGELGNLLPGSDVVVSAAPLTDRTHHLVDAAFLASMPQGSLFVNAGRGKIVNTDALLAELRAERIRAALDVTDPEPLPEDHPLWQAPGLIISPHMARTVPGTNELCYATAAEQIRRFHAGDLPANAVSPGLRSSGRHPGSPSR